MCKRFAALLCLLLTIVFSATALAVEQGDTIPDFMVKDLKGNDVKISDYRGQYVLYDVWATWCGPCKKAMKSYIQNYSRFEKAGIRIVAISVDAKAETAAEFAEKEKLPCVVLHDATKATKEQWGVKGIPTMFLVDPRGKVLLKEVGFDDFAGLWGKIKKVMNISADDDFVYPKLKPGAYPAEPVKVDWSALSANLTLSFVNSEEYDFAEKCPVKLTKEPKYGNTPMYGVVKVNGRQYVIVGVDSKKTGFMDTLYVDFNRNLDLTDDKPLDVPMFSNYSEVEFAVDENVPGLVPFLVTAYTYDKENKYYLTTGIGYQTTISTEGKALKALVLDTNANGRFDEAVDVILLDVDYNGIFDSFSAVLEWNTFGEVLKLKNESYKFRFDAASKKVIVEKQ